jgi:hypothetical protein
MPMVNAGDTLAARDRLLTRRITEKKSHLRRAKYEKLFSPLWHAEHEKAIRACGMQSIKNIFHAFGAQNIKNFFHPFHAQKKKKSRLQLAEYQNRACKPRLHRACGNEHIKKMFTPWARRIKKQKSRLRRADIKNLLYAFGVQYQKKIAPAARNSSKLFLRPFHTEYQKHRN